MSTDNPIPCDDFPDRFAAVLRSRRTIGAFRPDVPPRELVVSALELSCWAPNHRKTEPWRFALLGPETAASIVALNAELVAAKKGPQEAERKRREWSAVPGWLVVTCLRADDPIQSEEDYAASCCATQNLLLALWSRGIGTKWSTGDVTRHPRFSELVGFDPRLERMVGLIWYGYPASIPEQRRRPLADVFRERP